MNSFDRLPALDDHYCQVCSKSNNGNERRLSCFNCEHCRLSMCYDCFEKHTNDLIKDYSQIQQKFIDFSYAAEQKREFLRTFQENSMRAVDATFDEIIKDLETLRHESLTYVQQQFRDAEGLVDDVVKSLQPVMMKSQQQWAQNGISKTAMDELDEYRHAINEMENRLEKFSTPSMRIKMSTYPREKIELYCQATPVSLLLAKKFSKESPGKAVTTNCTYRQGHINFETDVEELQQKQFATRQVQTQVFQDDDDSDREDQIDTDVITENQAPLISTRHECSKRILAQNEVDRITSDGENLFYYSETSKSLCYVTKIYSSQQADGVSFTQEISCRWPNTAVLDLIYSPSSSEFVCATKTGVYSCTVNKNLSKIDYKLQLTQASSYVRLAVDKNYIWLWSDTPRASLLRTYSPRTYTCIKIFNLKDYPRFLDNSTSFCVHSNIIATLFQFSSLTNPKELDKYFHLNFCDTVSLNELCTIRLGPCKIDHEIRVGYDGLFYITNGKRKLWVVDRNGKKEYVKLSSIGRALTVHKDNQIIIANGTQQLQCVELSQEQNDIH